MDRSVEWIDFLRRNLRGPVAQRHVDITHDPRVDGQNTHNPRVNGQVSPRVDGPIKINGQISRIDGQISRMDSLLWTNLRGPAAKRDVDVAHDPRVQRCVPLPPAPTQRVSFSEHNTVLRARPSHMPGHSEPASRRTRTPVLTRSSV